MSGQNEEALDDSQIEEGQEVDQQEVETTQPDVAQADDLIFETEDGEAIAVPANARIRFKYRKDQVAVPASEFLGYGQIGYNGEVKKTELAEMQKRLKQQLEQLQVNPDGFKAVSEFMDWGRKPENRERTQLIDLLYTGELDPQEVKVAVNQLRSQGQARPAGAAKPAPKPKPANDWMSGEVDGSEEGEEAVEETDASAPPPWFAAHAEQTKRELSELRQIVTGQLQMTKKQREDAEAAERQNEEKKKAQAWTDLAIRTAKESSLIKQAYKGKTGRDVLNKLLTYREAADGDPIKAVRLLEAELDGFRASFQEGVVEAAAEVNDAFRVRPQRVAGSSRTATPKSAPPVEEEKLVLKPGILGEQSRSISTRAFRGLFGG